MILDIVIVLIIVLNIYTGYKRGFVDMVLNIGIILIALLFSRFLYLSLAAFLMTTALYDNLVDWVIAYMNLSEVAGQVGADMQAEVISRLPIPAFLLGPLEGMNFNVNVTVLEYTIGSGVAVVIINIISAVSIFLFVAFGLNILAKAIDIIAMLPVIRSINKSAGAVGGFIRAFVFVWLFLIIYNLVLARPGNFFMEQLHSSSLALWLHERNFILYILGVFI